MIVTPYTLAARFLGVAEVPGMASNPLILAMLQLDQTWPSGDDVAWCSAFASWIAWLLDLPRSKSLSARSWLTVGQEVTLSDAREGDIVVFSRGTNPAQGHVGFYAGKSPNTDAILVLGGNQGDRVSIQPFPTSRLLGVRRLEV
jgi:uncharacterized protein (TIGR02594 family)